MIARFHRIGLIILLTSKASGPKLDPEVVHTVANSIPELGRYWIILWWAPYSLITVWSASTVVYKSAIGCRETARAGLEAAALSTKIGALRSLSLAALTPAVLTWPVLIENARTPSSSTHLSPQIYSSMNSLLAGYRISSSLFKK